MVWTGFWRGEIQTPKRSVPGIALLPAFPTVCRPRTAAKAVQVYSVIAFEVLRNLRPALRGSDRKVIRSSNL